MLRLVLHAHNAFPARNPPPVCIGENIVDLEIEVCLHVYDIDVHESGKFHACFELFARIIKLRMPKLQLGCISSNVYRKLSYIKDNIIHHESLEFKSLTSKDHLIAEPLIDKSGIIWIHTRTELYLTLLLFSLYSSIFL